MSSWRRDFASGLVVLVPILVILYVLSILYSSIVKLPIIKDLNQPFGFFVAIVVFMMLVLSVGYLMRTTAGRLFESGIDAAMNRLPLVRVLYNASKLAVETALTGTEDLQKPVRLEVWPGIRMTGFKTGKTTQDGREVIFMPTAPNITTGFVMEVEPEDLTETDERVEEALTRILSAGFAEDESVSAIDIDVEEE
ncbi:DUF502 domain-containing protein [Halogeometricum borinquense]|uniref:DUF502 domain-containing protein n=1 Tax=Halogeometricum borinquense TaxID=60847 RepID=A0A6C0UD54_9EURY|nr:DUF502 domain-containing protein [Halogeometricum borinquense]QIB73047.1 DUF502 domain-containing protein [Halogeometricum borinquense]QIQ77553.1 DUF502 domain-containing protein [Halogeometricum borinquense]